jgi:putative hydrolase of HD superfamily
MTPSPQGPEETTNSTIRERLAFFLATDALKDIQRANNTFAGVRSESVAEHSWHVTLLAMLFADAAPDGTDHDRVRDLLTIHDLVEVYAGDTVVWDVADSDDVGGREQAAGERLMRLLPPDQVDRFDSLWREFQAQDTVEARFARAIDALHPMLMSWGPNGAGHPRSDLRKRQVLARKREWLEEFPVLWNLARAVVESAVERRLLLDDDHP